MIFVAESSNLISLKSDFESFSLFVSVLFRVLAALLLSYVLPLLLPVVLRPLKMRVKIMFVNRYLSINKHSCHIIMVDLIVVRPFLL